MKKSFRKFLVIFSMMLVGCGESPDPGPGPDPDPDPDPDPKEEHSYACSISWEGDTPIAIFSDEKDPSKTSEEIAPLFVEKLSRKVLSYPTETDKGIREHKVTYVLKDDDSISFSSSIDNKEFEFEKVDMNDPLVLNYLRAETLQEQYQALQAAKGKTVDYTHYTLEIPKYGNEMTNIFLASDAEFSKDIMKYSTDSNSYTFDYLIPGNTYYWKATGKTSGDEFDGGLFKVNEDNIRFGNFDRIGNMRDLGGWKTSENTRIKHNMIFRGRNVDSLNVTQKDAVTEAFGFKTQLDFRCDGDGPIYVKICPNVKYYYFNMSSIYNYFVERDLDYKAGQCQTPDEDDGRRLFHKEIIAKVFEVLGKEESYPLYFHCVHGADRTGTIAFLIEALLGVQLDDLVKDYELTSFNSKSGIRLRGVGNSDNTSFDEPLHDSGGYGWQQLLGVINGYDGETLQDRVTSFLMSEKIGVRAETIQSIKTLLTEQI